MIVVEGPDGAGKTTLIQTLSHNLGIDVAPRVVTKDTEAMVDLREWVDENLKLGFQATIFDRYRLISETIYGPILRQKSQPGFDQMSWLGPRISHFYHHKPIIIYCLPPLATVLGNIKDDEDNKAVVNSIESIYSAYVARAALDLAFAPGTIRVWDYTTTPTINGLPFWFNQVAAELKERTK